MNEVRSPKKPLIFYYIVAMLLVMLFNFIAMPWLSQYQIQEVDYNTFVDMTEKGEIGRAEIQEADNRILFTSKDEKTIYKTAMISTDSQLVQRLLDAGVSTSGEEIEQTSLLVSIFSWVAPILIFLASGAGARSCCHVNDSYFWVVTNFGGMKAEDGYKTQTMCTLLMGIASIVFIWVISLFFH